jgi:tetratricopeptide (TPR) repeat protein
MGHRTRTAVIASLGLACLAAAPAFGQHAVIAYGSGYARQCYEAVRSDRVFSARALQLCDIALEQEKNLSQHNRAASYINRGILYMRQQSHARAMQDYERGLAIMPDMPEAKINLGAVFYNLGRFEEAVTALNEGVKVENGEARAAAYYNRGLAHERLGNLDAAYADYNYALAVQPDFELASKQLKRFTRISAS